ncbi:MAG: hypothetical protein JSV80_16785 [Acidobacteriota bacterium]|nr:MAG: hypothetical protein JSV80_16785 [Acidobacteriota bacterium]
MAEIYRPSRSGLFRSVLFSLLPAGVAAVVVWLAGSHMNWMGWVASGLMGLLTLYLFLQTVFVFATKIACDERGLAVLAPLGAIGILWSDVKRAVLRERVNALSRTDHMLVLTGSAKEVVCNPSVLAPEDEQRLLDCVRAHVTVIVQRDKPSI